MTEKDKRLSLDILTKLQIVSALLLVTSFFLPWFKNPILSAAGPGISGFLKFISIPGPVDIILTGVATLIPVMGLVILGLILAGRSAALISMMTAMLPIILILVLMFYNPFILKQLAPGSIISLACALTLLITGALKPPGS